MSAVVYNCCVKSKCRTEIIMKALALILALVMVFSLFGCAAKEKPDDDKKEEVTTDEAPSDEKDEGENNGVESGDKNDTSGDNDASGGDKKDPADTTDSDNKVNGGETDDKKRPEDTKKPSNDTQKAPDETKKPVKDTEKPDEGNKEPDKGVTDKTPVGEYKDGVVLEAYLYSLAEVIHGDFTASKDAKSADLLHLTAHFINSQRSSLIGGSGNAEQFAVPGRVLEKNLKLLFGDSLSLSDFSSYLDTGVGESYESATDTYLFNVSYHISDYYLSMSSPMKITEDDTTLTAKVTVESAAGESFTVTYSFKKIVVDEYLYLRLTSAEK